MTYISQKIDEQFALAEDLIDQLKYKEAFQVFQEVALNSENSPVERANAYAGMGELVECCDPGLASGDDESGLEFYKQALLLDNHNFHALLGIIGSFGESFPDHQDVAIFKLAYHQLINRKSKLDIKDLKTLKEKYLLMQKLERKKGK
ncbi:MULTISPECIES: hypothetical protein [unclassified Candidatus Cardinium]|uniref:hypothetical protein n=1 Tax=unclassified Candidatus Cardinium TaxID=2641185 RepID=UPI001FB3DB11|nr:MULTISPECIES: hypothetical protein [unclassified Candidatus Cardinium]